MKSHTRSSLGLLRSSTKSLEHTLKKLELICIGKIRRTRLARKCFCELALSREHDSRGLLGKLVEIANQVGLVVVATLERNTGPSRVTPFNCAKNLLESENTTQ